MVDHRVVACRCFCACVSFTPESNSWRLTAAAQTKENQYVAVNTENIKERLYIHVTTLMTVETTEMCPCCI